MCDFDEQLKKLALNAQRHPLGTVERRQLVEQLLRLLSHSDQLVHPPVPAQLQGSYEEIYNIALQRLFQYLYEKIEHYKPERAGVLQWVNYLLKIRFPDAIKELTNDQKKNQLVRENLVIKHKLERKQRENTENYPVTAQDIIDYIKQDPQDVFRLTYIGNNAEANFRFIALKLVEGYKLDELAIMLDVNHNTLRSFYNRSRRKFASEIRKNLEI
ncbi:hypothetical protein K4A83_13325 [Spirulina subsalsa FACHB-351]|uniref:Sigma-70 family RNA polymerase sigma factor n=1 Tax=Spirulina subsalsa FACHB-351 TaxID=234711 RepID=A0ABT3L6W3_9CYAN|nr:hypothetical protein [Spirulina subsalsa]MCW6037244.1 hypothetical protein [Spirulina subsalsa FACHB-351]